MARHLLFFGKFFSFPVFLLFFLCGPDIIRKPPTADAFNKISFPPRPSRQSHVKDLFPSALESRDDFLGRSDEPKRTRQIVGCAQRKNAQRNASINEAKSNLCNCPVTPGGQNEIGRLLERFL